MNTYYGSIENCVVTHTNAYIKLPWIDSVDSRYYRRNNNSFHSGIDLLASSVYTPCNCVILEVALCSKNLYSVLYQYSADMCIKYSNLSSVSISDGELVLADSLIGTAKDYVHIEYWSSVVHIPRWVCRFGPLQMYKHDPTDIVSGKFEFNNEIQLDVEPETEGPHPPDYVEGVFNA